MTHSKILLGTAVALVLGTATSPAKAIMVDGDLSDWGITVAGVSGVSCHGGYVGKTNPAEKTDCTGTSYANLLSTTDLVGYALEDTNDTRDDYEVGPNWGGQNYDAEFLGAAVQGGKLFVAILSGQRPDNGFPYFSPGDLLIDVLGVTGEGAYGVEIGGGAGGNGGTSISKGAEGSTYTLNLSGYTTAHTASTAVTAGSVWKNPDWILDPILYPNPPGYQKTQIKPDTGSKVGVADAFVFTRNSQTNQHSVIEIALDLSLFGSDKVTGLHWRPSCGNDTLDIVFSPQQRVPEPATLALLGLGLAGIGFARRTKARR